MTGLPENNLACACSNRLDAETDIKTFLECLCRIFSKLAEAYVRQLKGQLSGSDIACMPTLGRAVQETITKFPSIDSDAFASGLTKFFRDPDPDYDAIKWHMAQNYYVALALGYDSTGCLLSREIFGNATFYLDTNILVHALVPGSRLLEEVCQNSSYGNVGLE